MIKVSRDSKAQKKCVVLIISCLLCFFLLEIFCSYYLEPLLDKKILIFSANIQEGDDVEDFMDKLGDPSNLNIASPKLPHPFFGYTRPLTKENLPLDSKVYGFVERPELWNFEKEPNTLYIGFFGASVAAKAFFFEENTHVFKTALRKHLRLSPHKNIRLLNFSYGGYKQPQQFIISSFFIDKLDATINIDGANEINNVASDYFPPHYPKHMISSLYFSSNQYKSKAIQYALFKDYFEASTYKNKLKVDSPLFSFMRTYLKARFYYLWKKIIQNLSQINKFEDTFWLKPNAQQTGATSVRLWSKFLRQQHAFATSMKVPSVYFLQPITYTAKKNLSAEEKNFLSQIDSKRLETLLLNYKLFSEEVAHLQSLGLPVFNMQNIFENSEQTVFTDNCCHLNEVGNTLLLEKIAKILAAEMNHRKNGKK
jgi:hypothetical protein